MKRKFIKIGSARVPVALVAVAAGCLIAACGSATSGSASSSSTSSTTASASASGTAGSARRTQLVACLKSHGVTLPARPAGSGPPPGGGAGGSGGAAGGSGGAGGGTGSGSGSGSGTGSRRGFFGGGAKLTPKMRAAFQACGASFGAGGGGFRGRISHTAVTKYVTCVRQHGYNLPSPNFSGKGPIFPRSIQTNAKFQAASKACQSLLTPARPSGGTTSTTSGA